MMRFSRNKVTTIRKDLGLKQKHLAHKTGISQSMLSGIEAGSKYPGLETLENLAHALGVHPGRFFV